jgi:hypothetical protein
MTHANRITASLNSLLGRRLPVTACVVLFAAQVAIIAAVAAHPERFPADPCCKARADTFDPRAA